jgi:DNA-directed RNA polymerase subunit beta
MITFKRFLKLSDLINEINKPKLKPLLNKYKSSLSFKTISNLVPKTANLLNKKKNRKYYLTKKNSLSFSKKQTTNKNKLKLLKNYYKIQSQIKESHCNLIYDNKTFNSHSYFVSPNSLLKLPRIEVLNNKSKINNLYFDLLKKRKFSFKLIFMRTNKFRRKSPLLKYKASTDTIAIQLYLAERRRVQVGDKMAGRHGNKGIISQILPREDMPFLPDGTSVDMVLNPLGVPSRMNVGQIYECLLGLAGKHLGENYKIFPFDEIYGAEASRSFVYAKLNQARFKTGKKWLFNPNSPGKIKLYDGRTGDTFDQSITTGYAYMLRLVHMVDDKIHARSTGPYGLITQQPLRGRGKLGGQRLGEMEVWALEGYGAAFILLEMLTVKSDDITGRMQLWSNLLLNRPISLGTPESFKVLVCELQALCIDVGLLVESKY